MIPPDRPEESNQRHRVANSGRRIVRPLSNSRRISRNIWAHSADIPPFYEAAKVTPPVNQAFIDRGPSNISNGFPEQPPTFGESICV
uniref:Uncharacterized protein n=1 Tax=Candidatus Kentrum sp. TC TaxID=2126339 RepID=A0A450Z2H2_9GAMM|nr:MAG: hypothetical protein BECKTC1821D_GA0114238_10551 [Candidatus Kentron sp. TC]